MDRLTQDLKIAARALSRQRAFTIVAVITLALGVGATTAIFSVVYGILLRPLPYAEADRLVHLGQTARSAPADPVDGSSAPVNVMDWKRHSTTIRPMAIYTGGRAVISHLGAADVVRSGTVSPDFFAVFKATPIVGREFSDEENRTEGPRAAIISHGFWQERFGGRADIQSQAVEISGVPWPIVGVAPRGFDYPNGARLWTPVRNNDQQCGRGCDFVNAIGRLADGATATAAQDEMTAIAATLEREFPNANTDVTVMVQTLTDRLVGSVRLALVALLAAVAMLLLIACANVANLVLVRGSSRQQELAVRTALGAGTRGRLSYLLSENLLLALGGGVVGLILAAWGVDALKTLAPTNLPRLDDIRFDLPTFGFALAVVFATIGLFGLIPSWQLSAAPPVRALSQRSSLGVGHARWTRSTLLIAEVGFSLVLLLGAGLLLRSLLALQKIEMGFNPSGLTAFTISLPPARYPTPQVVQTHDRIDDALRACLA